MATGQQLQQVYELIKNGHKEHAASLLSVWLVADPCNADAWWLLALAAPTHELTRRALTKLLEMRPDDIRARQLLDSMSVRQLMADARSAAVEFQNAPQPAYPPSQLEPRLPRLRRRTRKPRNRRGGPTRTFYVALAFSCLFGVAGCALMVLAVASGFDWINHLFENAPVVVPVIHAGTLWADPVDLGDINALGNTGLTQYRTGLLDSMTDRHRYVFSGRAGDWVAIEITTPDSMLDPAVALYSESGVLIGGNTDRSPSDTDAAIALALPYNGSYTAVVSVQAGEGAYRLQLRR